MTSERLSIGNLRAAGLQVRVSARGRRREDAGLTSLLRPLTGAPGGGRGRETTLEHGLLRDRIRGNTPPAAAAARGAATRGAMLDGGAHCRRLHRRPRPAGPSEYRQPDRKGSVRGLFCLYCCQDNQVAPNVYAHEETL